ncbi:MAG: urate hydroxylase PuuD [Deltaproteobacteria bacterium]|nr:urate hydroxylase PuuD [Deltaproteobacteria bacterium]
MQPFVEEWLNLVVRWAHVIAAIMWVGDSFLFMWLDSHLHAPTRARSGAVTGELWMTHSGGFYEVVKRKSLAQDEMPGTLYWFKWESYSTWITGFLLLIIVFHTKETSLLIDPLVMKLTRDEAATLSIGLLPVAYGFYELLWLTPLKNHMRVFAAVGVGCIAALAYGLTQVFSARGAFLQVGATLGTIMASNVFFRIIPAQRHMLAATRAGQPVDTGYGLRAKGRSVQNHYLTLPVLFTMLSNHFPSTYGSDRPWLTLTLLVIVGMGVKYAMNARLSTPPWALGGTIAALITVIGITRPAPDRTVDIYASQPEVKFNTVAGIVKLRCVTCHAEHPTNAMFTAPPMGVRLDTTDYIRQHAERVFVRAVSTHSMPLANMTGMTDEERDELGRWFAHGADVPWDAQMPREQPVSSDEPAVASDSDKPQPAHGEEATKRAKAYFKTVCASCHGQDGKGDGIAAAVLNPKPRDFADPNWQQSVTDQHIRETILKGGPAVGKSALMPAQVVLANDPETLNEIVKLVRAFGAE